jgi:hypothetical protein
MLYCGFTILPAKLRKLRNSISSRVGELVIVIRVRFLVDASSALGSMPKESCKVVANWLVKLLGSAHGPVVARAGVMSIGYGLKGNCAGVS